MKTRAHRGLWITLLFSTLCLAVGIIAACGSSESSTFPNGGLVDGGGTSGSSGNSGTIGQFPPGAGDGSPDNLTLKIEPPSATLAVTNRAQPPTQIFVAKDAAGNVVSAAWTLDDYTAGSIDAKGVFTAKGTVGAKVNVIATFGGATATATIDLTISLKDDLGNVTLPDGRVITQDSTLITAPNRTALGGAPTDEGDGGTALTYPYDKTVMPRGLLAPVPQFTAGTHPPEDFKVTLDATGFHWEGLGHVPVSLEAAIPQPVWDGAFLSAAPDPTTKERVVTLSVVKASGGVAYGPASTHIIVAPASLTGVIYFSSYSTNQLMNDAGGGGTDFGLWSVRPGSTQPPNHLKTGCVICHSVSANGKTLTTGADQGGPGSGVYSTNGTTVTQLAGPPAGLGGDSRGLSWTAISPDGDYILRSKNDFWGGDTLLAWKTPSTADAGAPLSDTVPVKGSNIKMYVPAYSPDGTKLVYVNADGTLGTASRSLGLVDVTIDHSADAGANGAVVLANPRTIYDSTKAGASPANQWTRVPTFLPDSHDIVFQQTSDSAPNSSQYNGMLPNWSGTEYVETPGALFALRQKTDGSYATVALTNANTGSKAAFASANYEPKPLPVQAGGYYWVVFTSIRSDGINGPPIKKLWITAISPGAAPESDPSHPPFLITNQSIIPTQHCERGYWSVEPCHEDGATCATGDDCCNGFCRPSVDGDPQSPYVCKKPTVVTCANEGDRCRAGHSEDCCGAASGVACIGSLNGFGTCAIPSPR